MTGFRLSGEASKTFWPPSFLELRSSFQSESFIYAWFYPVSLPPFPPIRRPAVLTHSASLFCFSLTERPEPPHRVKSISMTTFTEPEVLFLQARGNEVSRRCRNDSRMYLPCLSVEFCLRSQESPYSFLSEFPLIFLVCKVSYPCTCVRSI